MISLTRSRFQFSSRSSKVDLFPRRLRATSSDDKPEKAEDEFENLFARELKARGVNQGKLGGSGEPPKFRSPPPPPMGPPSELDGQRERTLGFVNDGLEGLIPRGKLLLQLGGGLFLAFLPFMATFSVLFTVIFYAFPEGTFLHGGRPQGMIYDRPEDNPKYMDPASLLSEQTVDPYIPFNR